MASKRPGTDTVDSPPPPQKTPKTSQPPEACKGIAVVTGGSRGIGAATARLLGSLGYRVAVCFCGSEEAAKNVVADIEGAGGVAAAFKVDMRSEDSIVQLFANVEKHWQGIAWTALVNNAGILGEAAKLTLDKLTGAAFQEMMNTNVLGPSICCREFAKHAKSGAAIVNVSSGAAVIASGLYGMTKAALNSMQAWLVPELAKKGIRMNAVSPGMTDTDMISQAKQGFDMSMIPMGRFGKPEEIADSIAFLLSDKASYVTGGNLRIAGGRPPGTFIG
eukprot:TRINITY_DN47024_c0_g1_i1.p1 TRINITY_DN47024_c0_g1~~TRINITY_DN47024_c0_g1_i1.p1  ORF type:complete len:276 (-),score=60.57 TRINITY_DN47024_c0_g1_i1:186-1013(-)